MRAVWTRVDIIASEARKTAARARHGAAVQFGPGVRLAPGVVLELFDGGTIELGARTHVGHGALLSARGGSVRIGRDGLVNTGSVIVSTRSISIGNDALIAEHVTIRDQDHAHDASDRPYRAQGRRDAPVAIGDNVWLGAKVTVTKGVTIAANCIVGANAVVTKSLPDAGVYVGAPARNVGPVPASPHHGARKTPA